MATVTGLTAERMLEIEAESIVGGVVDAGTGHLVLTRHDGGTIDAGLVVSSENLVDTLDDQSINGLKTFLELATFDDGVASKYVSLSGNAITQSPIFVNAPTGQTAQIVNLQKNGVTQFQIDQNGVVAAPSSDHYFGTNALGGTGECLHIKVDGSNVILKGEASHADCSIVLTPKGVGGLYFQKSDGTNWGWFGSDGTLNLQQQSLHIRSSASVNKRAQAFFESFSGVPEWSLLSDSLVNGTHDFGLYDNVNSRFGWKVDNSNNFLVLGSIQAKAANNYFGLNADGSAGVMGRIVAGDGTDPSVYLQAQGSIANVQLILKTQGTGSLFFQDGGGISHLSIGPAGNLAVNGPDHYFGPNSIAAAAGSRVHLTAPTTAGVGVYAESSAADCSLTIMSKGASSIFLNPRGGVNNGLAITTDVNGKIYLVNNASGSGGTAPGFVFQVRTGGAFQLWDGTNTIFAFNLSGDHSFYVSGSEKLRLEGSQSRLVVFGDTNGIMGNNAAGTAKYVIGLRPDIIGNSNDLVNYTYGGRIIFATSGTVRFLMTTDGGFQISSSTDPSTAATGGWITYTGVGGQGNGASGGLTGTLKGTAGNGPASLANALWLKIYWGGATSWIPVFQ